MFKRILIISSVAALMTSGGIAMAGSSEKSAAEKARPNIYKEAQSKANAAPAPGTVNPDAETKRPALYKESTSKANAAPAPGTVNPDAATKRKKRAE